MNEQVTAYIKCAPSEQKQMMEAVRQLIHSSVPDVSEEFKWSRPVFRAAKDFAYLKTAKAYVTLGFFNFEKLEDKDNLLEGSGKDMRHIKLKSTSDIDRPLLESWFRAAAR
ncbi:DUF1801 domain-containing protein [Pontibacter roseus]|uniref:DUF1801 domain-containing protein n=1 Tax=Pontibacter roseus TaxID=336989 RepID=UPI00036C9BDA|nr:DUF1801 domain-containing protein [Pontibacter roseus]